MKGCGAPSVAAFTMEDQRLKLSVGNLATLLLVCILYVCVCKCVCVCACICPHVPGINLQ